MSFDNLDEIKSLQPLFRRLLVRYYEDNPTSYRDLAKEIGIGLQTIHGFLAKGSRLGIVRLVKVKKFLEKMGVWQPSWGVEMATKLYKEERK